VSIYSEITFARKIIFWVLLAFYIITLPILLMFAFGITLEPRGNKPVIRTGILEVSSRPSGSLIKINGKSVKEKTPAVIENMKPGIYTITLVKDKYRSWEARVEIKADSVTHLDSVILFPQRLKQKSLLIKPFRNFIPFANGEYALLLSDSVNNISFYDIKSGTILEKPEELATYDDYVIIKVENVPSSNLVFLFLLGAEGISVIGLDTQMGKLRIQELTEKFETLPDKILWYSPYLDMIYFLKGETLYSIGKNDESTRNLIASSVIGTGYYKNSFFYMLQNGKIFEINRLGIKLPHIKIEEEKIRRYFGGGKNLTIFYAEGKKIGIFLKEERKLLIVSPERELTWAGITGEEVDVERDRILLWTEKGVGTINIPDRFLDNELPEVKWYLNAIKKINPIGPIGNNSHFLFSREGKIIAKPILPKTQGKEYEIVEGLPKEKIYYSEETGKLVMVKPAKGQIRSLKIIPEKGFSVSKIIK